MADRLEMAEYLLNKLGMNIVEEDVFSSDCITSHMYDSLWGWYRPLCIVKCFGFRVSFMPCMENLHCGLQSAKYASDVLIDTILSTRTMSIAGFKFRIGNPFFMHYELNGIKTLDEFKVQADLVFPDDITSQVKEHMMAEIQALSDVNREQQCKDIQQFQDFLKS